MTTTLSLPSPHLSSQELETKTTQLVSLLPSLTLPELRTLLYDWSLWGRPNQQLPPLDNYSWDNWLLLAGRGFGKTRTGAESVRQIAKAYPTARIAMIAPTAADARDVMVEGESGILAISPPTFRPIYEPSKRRLTWPNGAMAFLYSAEEPERLRGPQHSHGWVDELCAWEYPQETWDMYQFGLRLGTHPRTIITTTPKPIPLVRNILKEEASNSTVVTRGSTYDNKANLARSFFKQVAQYEGTKLGEQELHAVLLDPSEAGIVKKSDLKFYPANRPLPRFEFIVQSYDTSYTEKTYNKKTHDRDPTAASTWGVFKHPNKDYYCILLLDAWQDHLGYPALRKKVLDEFNHTKYNNQSPNLALIEDKGAGISLRQDLQSQIKIVPYNPGKDDKMARLHAVSHLPHRGRVYIPESPSKPGEFIDWAVPLIEQLTCFPEVVHDDYVDTTSQVLAYCRDLGYLTIDVAEIGDTVDYSTSTRINPYAS